MKFTVEQIKQKDAGRRLVTLPEQSVDKLGLSHGDFVRIKNGEKNAFARVWPSYPQASGANIIRLDSDLREEINASILDRVEVRRAEIEPAESVSLALLGGIKFAVDTKNAERFLQIELGGRVVHQGGTVSINADDQDIDKEMIRLEVTEVTPLDYAVMTETTEVSIAETTR